MSANDIAFSGGRSKSAACIFLVRRLHSRDVRGYGAGVGTGCGKMAGARNAVAIVREGAIGPVENEP